MPVKHILQFLMTGIKEILHFHLYKASAVNSSIISIMFWQKSIVVFDSSWIIITVNIESRIECQIALIDLRTILGDMHKKGPVKWLPGAYMNNL
jgi:hypothetical protein